MLISGNTASHSQVHHLSVRCPFVVRYLYDKSSYKYRTTIVQITDKCLRMCQLDGRKRAGGGTLLISSVPPPAGLCMVFA